VSRDIGDHNIQNRISYCFVQNMTDENAVTLKLAPFWTSQPHVWFQQTEVQFALKNITADSTKYYYVITA